MTEQRATVSQDHAHPGAAAPAPGTVSPETGSPAPEVTLAVNGVSVRLGGREVLHDVRFTIRRGEFVGLIGANGAGKTTLMRVILGLVQPSAGEVRIGGRPRRKRAGIG